jgi:hypothetical protein
MAKGQTRYRITGYVSLSSSDRRIQIPEYEEEEGEGEDQQRPTIRMDTPAQ